MKTKRRLAQDSQPSAPIYSEHPMRHAIQKTDSAGQTAFSVFPAGEPSCAYRLLPAFEWGDCYLSPDESLLVVYSSRRVLGEKDTQLDFYAVETGRLLYSLTDVDLDDVAFRRGGGQLLQREVYSAPRRSKKRHVGRTLVRDAGSGAETAVHQDDGALFEEEGTPLLAVQYVED